MSEETITIALCLGLNSISAAAVLSGRHRQTPVTVPWPKSSLSYVPLRLQSTEVLDRWGYDCVAAESSSHWGLICSGHGINRPYRWSKIRYELLRKRGIPSLPLTVHQHDEGLGTLIRLVTTYIHEWLSSKYGDAALISKRIVLVIPPYRTNMSEVLHFEQLLRKNCSIDFKVEEKFFRVSYIHAVLHNCQDSSFEQTNSIISCYMDLELTVVTRYSISRGFTACPSALNVTAGKSKTLTTGAHDVVEAFGRVLQDDPMLGRKCNEENLARAKEWFMKNLHLRTDQLVQRSVSGLGRIQTDPRTFEMQVFSRVFKQISAAMSGMYDPATTCISLSGPLAVVPSLRSYLPEGVHVLESSRAGTFSCEGAALLPSTHLRFTRIHHEKHIDLGAPHQAAHQSFNLNGTPHLVDFRINHYLLKFFGIYHTNRAVQLLSEAKPLFRARNMLGDHVKLCRDFFVDVSKVVESELAKEFGPELAKAFKAPNPLHMAATFNYESIVLLAIDAGFSVNERSTFRYLFGTFKHSPLHASVWFNDNEAMVRLLLQWGATLHGFEHECPMHFAVAKDRSEVLKMFEAHCRDTFMSLAPDLLQLAIHLDARKTVRFLISYGVAHQETKTFCPSKLSRLGGARHKPYKPLEEMLTRGWAEEARLVLRRQARDAGWRKRPSNSSIFAKINDETEKMKRLIDQWMSRCPHCTDEHDRNALYWALKLGHESLVWKHERSLTSIPEYQKHIRRAFRTAIGVCSSIDIIILLGNYLNFTEAEKSLLPDMFPLTLSADAQNDLLHEATRTKVEKLDLWSQNGQKILVELLLKRGGVDVNSKGRDGRTVLSRAATKDDEAIVRLLLETSKADVNLKDNDEWTPLHRASSSAVVTKLLLGINGINVNSKGSNEATALHEAVRNNCMAVVKLLLEKEQLDVDPKDSFDITPLWLAARRGHGDIVKVLLETGRADVNQEAVDTRTPLIVAAFGGHNEVIKTLLKTGRVDINSTDVRRNTPLHMAAWMGKVETVCMLLQMSQVNVNLRNNEGKTPLQMAREKRHSSIVEALEEYLQQV